jgi:hypothetical protein
MLTLAVTAAPPAQRSLLKIRVDMTSIAATFAAAFKDTEPQPKHCCTAYRAGRAADINCSTTSTSGKDTSSGKEPFPHVRVCNKL